MNEKQIKLVRGILIAVIIVSILIIIVGELTNNFAIFFPAREGNVLFFYHFWTSSGERAALNALIAVFTNKYPDIVVLPSSLISKSASGGGVELFNLLKPILLSGESPDAVLMHAGYETKTYVDAELLDNVNLAWKTDNLDLVVPKIVKVMCKFNGDYYSVPVGIHRTNVVWYNKNVLDENGIDYSTLTTWESFFNACDKLKSAGVEYPIQLAAAWTAQHTFDQIIASEGIGFYEKWVNGKVTEDDAELLDALTKFKKYLSYVNSDHANIEWNTATKRIIDGESAFNIMGDWANGEFKAEGKVYGTDYGTFVVPGTNDMYGLVIDTFQLPKHPKHPASSEKWLEVIGSKEGQDAFNPLKGSISARTDTDVSKYDQYQKTAILDFASISKIKGMYPAVSNGAPKEFEVEEQRIIAEFTKDLDIQKAAKAITDFQKDNSGLYTITWELG
ncbi:MAG: ABC transporter substrate-binding protein [Candidatus Nanoarchaeia archaeon]|nr:ABC transporter substrate-binding protein [Candidatus Nanoarchaeia archaeon]MDD5357821.1 ABC transporter substrate-binding protein [Candidatus Nanoarchaeia archaeon]MDD5588740.1 ABC transporter substrate-binding protein [Candidatus Nanoarchaeia archaeon]